MHTHPATPAPSLGDFAHVLVNEVLAMADLSMGTRSSLDAGLGRSFAAQRHVTSNFPTKLLVPSIFTTETQRL